MKKVVKLIGYPLGHSVSPSMQNAAFGKLGLDYEYSTLAVPPEKLEETIEELRNDLNVIGFNLTIPYKEAIFKYLENNEKDENTSIAKEIKAVNTVVNINGKLQGWNTDGEGFIRSTREDLKIDPLGKKIVIFGAGGASKAVATTLADHSNINSGESTITITDIDKTRCEKLVGDINFPFAKANSVEINSPELKEAIAEAGILINATPIGMHPNIDQSPLPENIKLHKNLVVYDLVYNPAETKLLKQAKAAGAKAVSGLGMLVHQGALAFKLWTRKDPDIKVMFKAAKNALR